MPKKLHTGTGSLTFQNTQPGHATKKSKAFFLAILFLSPLNGTVPGPDTGSATFQYKTPADRRRGPGASIPDQGSGSGSDHFRFFWHSGLGVRIHRIPDPDPQHRCGTTFVFSLTNPKYFVHPQGEADTRTRQQPPAAAGPKEAAPPQPQASPLFSFHQTQFFSKKFC
jgi:hypothetical protein